MLKKLIVTLLAVMVVVSLARVTLGQTTYYIDPQTGLQTNSGTDTGHPWKCFPGQSGLTGQTTASSACTTTAEQGIAQYSHHTGDHFIQKGATTMYSTWWDGCIDSCSSAMGMSVNTGGTSGTGNQDYYGVDDSWFAGASYTAPVWSGCPSSGCPVDLRTMTPLFVVLDTNYVTFDGFNVQNFSCTFSNQVPGGCGFIYIRNPHHDLTFTHNEVHKWYLEQHSDSPSIEDGAYGGIYHNDAGGSTSQVQNTVARFNKIHNDDGGILNAGCSSSSCSVQYPKCCGYAFGFIQTYTNNEIYGMSDVNLFGGKEVAYNYIHDIISLSGTLSTCGNCQSTNSITDWAWDGSSNNVSSDCVVHDNIIKNDFTSAYSIYVGPNNPITGTHTCTVYNNVVVNSQWCLGIDPAQTGTSGANFNVKVNNNTCEIAATIDGQTNSAATYYTLSRPAPDSLGNVIFKNNHSINDNATVTSFSSGTLTYNTPSENLEQTHSTATNYSSANNWAPSNNQAAGVGNGVSVSCGSSSCPDFSLGFDPSQGALFGGMTFNTIPRPVSGNWDEGAYQFINQFIKLLAGDQSVEGTTDFASAGTAQADQVTASSTGSVKFITFYVDSGNLATSWIVGLYSDSNGSPATLLTSATDTSLTNGAWNSVSVSAVNVSSGTAYWIAVLSPQGGGTAKFRDSLNGGCVSQSSQSQSLTALPSTWTTGTTYNSNCPLSAYASGQ